MIDVLMMNDVQRLVEVDRCVVVATVVTCYRMLLCSHLISCVYDHRGHEFHGATSCRGVFCPKISGGGLIGVVHVLTTIIKMLYKNMP